MADTKPVSAATARMATMEVLRRDILPNFLNPVPSSETLANWFRAAKIPHAKANPCAKKGGGVIWWHVAGVERFLRNLLNRQG